MKKVLLVLAGVALLAVLAWAEHGPRGKGMCGPGPGMAMGMGMKSHGEGCGDRGDCCGKPGMPGMPGLRQILMMAEEIKLTPEQQDKLEKMMTEFQKERIGRQAELEKAQVDVHALIRDDKAAEADVNAAIDKVSRLKADLQKMRYGHWKQAKAVLTEEQIAKLKDLRKECRKEIIKDIRIMEPEPGPGGEHGMGSEF